MLLSTQKLNVLTIMHLKTLFIFVVTFKRSANKIETNNVKYIRYFHNLYKIVSKPV